MECGLCYATRLACLTIRRKRFEPSSAPFYRTSRRGFTGTPQMLSTQPSSPCTRQCLLSTMSFTRGKGLFSTYLHWSKGRNSKPGLLQGLSALVEWRKEWCLMNRKQILKIQRFLKYHRVCTMLLICTFQISVCGAYANDSLLPSSSFLPLF